MVPSLPVPCQVSSRPHYPPAPPTSQADARLSTEHRARLTTQRFKMRPSWVPTVRLLHMLRFAGRQRAIGPLGRPTRSANSIGLTRGKWVVSVRT